MPAETSATETTVAASLAEPEPISDLKPLIQRVVDGQELTQAEASSALDWIMTGGATPVQVAALFTALRMRGETVAEITGFAETMRRHSVAVHLAVDPRPVIDTCGTGGDNAGTFNISTTAAFVVAAAGVRVAKHGNRSMTSQCGSADVLEGLGVQIALGPEQVARCVNEVGIGFMFAQAYHPSMKYLGPVRREIGIRTIFNVLGPVTNPAGVRRQLIGVADPAMARRMAAVLASLGSERALVVSACDGLDEIGVSGETLLVEHSVETNGLREFTITPDQVGLQPVTRDAILGGSVETNVTIVQSVLAGEPGGPRTATLINAGAALYVSGIVDSIPEGVKVATEAIDSGRASAKLHALVNLSQSFQN